MHYSGCLPVDARPDLVVVLSGPRCDSGQARRNANPGRLLPALWDATSFKKPVPVLVSGHSRESHLLQAEIDTLVESYRLQLASPIRICDRAEHTAGNAIYTLARARREFFDFDRHREWNIAIYTDDWHMPRASLNFCGVQMVLRIRNAEWRRAQPFRYLFVQTTPINPLDPDFIQSFRDGEVRKLAADKARLMRWRKGDLQDAPIHMVEEASLNNPVADNDTVFRALAMT